jgi:NAD(P)-dependent dehydrogenase (short-subunit alcohol dehydrogenase family)
LSNFPNNFERLRFDVTNKEQITTAFNQVKTKLNGNHLHGLLNNAGLSIGSPMSLLPDDKFREQIEVNSFGVRNVTNIFLPLLGTCKGFTDKSGKIIIISSLAGVFNTPFN